MGEKWRERLRQAAENDGRSMREISLEADLAHNYLYTILKKGKTPGIDSLMRILRVLDISLAEIVEGYQLDRDSRAILRIWGELSPDERGHMEGLLRALLASRSKGP
jgi:transcriptional regulator with XRE-family HTH domain